MICLMQLASRHSGSASGVAGSYKEDYEPGKRHTRLGLAVGYFQQRGISVVKQWAAEKSWKSDMEPVRRDQMYRQMGRRQFTKAFDWVET